MWVPGLPKFALISQSGWLPFPQGLPGDLLLPTQGNITNFLTSPKVTPHLLGTKLWKQEPAVIFQFQTRRVSIILSSLFGYCSWLPFFCWHWGLFHWSNAYLLYILNHDEDTYFEILVNSTLWVTWVSYSIHPIFSSWVFNIFFSHT